MRRTQSEIKGEFFNYINTKCKLNEKEEDAVLKLNLLVTNCFKPEETQENDNKCKPSLVLDNEPHSETYEKINETFNEIIHTKDTLNALNNEIEGSFNKLNSILNSRNTLSVILKDFNTSTKMIINDKEKMGKLIKSIDIIYKTYEQTLSIQAFLDNNDCILKHRFISDYEEIEKGISFFSMNSNYIDSAKYLQTYDTLKIICINKYYSYFAEGLSQDHTVASQDELFIELLKGIPASKWELFAFPKSFEKMKYLAEFFDKKSKDDFDIKKTQEKLKQKFLEIRTLKISSLFNTICQNINDSYYNNENKAHFDKINYELSQILLYVLINIIHYGLMFNFEFRKDVYILKSFISDIFNMLYDTIRPIIVSLVSLEELMSLFDALSDNFGIFFIDIDNSNNSTINIPSSDDNIIDANTLKKINGFFANFFKVNYPTVVISGKMLNEPQNMLIITQFLKIAKNLIRPTVLHLIQDTQEKIYFKISQHVNSNFTEIELDFPSFGFFEQTLYSEYKHFSLFHFFLKRITIINKIFKDKLDKKILSEILVSSIETFISILNSEIIQMKKNITYEFQIYIIQQILLCMQIVDEFKIETIETGIQLDFGFITEVFKSNYESIINGKFTIAEVMTNSAPKILDATKDFKKILYNNLLKSYKIFINLSNDFIFGRSFMDIIHKIQNKITKEELLKVLIEKQKEIIEVLSSISDKLKKILGRFSSEIRPIDNEKYLKIEKIAIENVRHIHNILNAQIASIEADKLPTELFQAINKTTDELQSILDKDIIPLQKSNSIEDNVTAID